MQRIETRRSSMISRSLLSNFSGLSVPCSSFESLFQIWRKLVGGLLGAYVGMDIGCRGPTNRFEIQILNRLVEIKWMKSIQSERKISRILTRYSLCKCYYILEPFSWKRGCGHNPGPGIGQEDENVFP